MDKITCPTCGESMAVTKFYKSKSPMYMGVGGYIPFCKKCLLKEYDLLINSGIDMCDAFKIMCVKFNIPFDANMYEGAVKEDDNCKEVSKVSNPFQKYMKSINSLGVRNNINNGFDYFKLFIQENKNIEIAKDQIIEEKMQQVSEMAELDENDKVAKKDVINLLGYDPFFAYSEFDQKFLYNDLLPFLNEDSLEDSYKLSQIIQIVNNNCQIKKIDLSINFMSNPVEELRRNRDEIKSLTSIKRDITNANDKIAKENAISVKNRSDKKAGKSTLTNMMKDLRELGFEKAEVDYYDQLTAKGMRKVMDESNKSIIQQIHLDENDYVGMISQQREIIQTLQDRVDEIEEENRKLYAGEIKV